MEDSSDTREFCGKQEHEADNGSSIATTDDRDPGQLGSRTILA